MLILVDRLSEVNPPNISVEPAAAAMLEGVADMSLTTLLANTY
jgi:hypothetical protein